jgi:trehalose-6-phosphate synthase
MTHKERAKRMKSMRKQVQKHTVFDWGAKIFDELESIRPVKEVA